MTFRITTLSIMQNIVMLSATYKPFMQRVIMPNAVRLSVVVPTSSEFVISSWVKNVL
jgi:hypothetical protein